MTAMTAKEKQHLYNQLAAARGLTGARLVEDGIIGPKSLAAFARAAVEFGEDWVGTDLPPIEGIDVSQCQERIDWQAVVGSKKVHFAYARATIDRYGVDAQFAANWKGMREAGMPRGAYHVFYSSSDPNQQADHFFATVGCDDDPLKLSTLPPMVDVEIEQPAWISGAMFAQNLAQFCSKTASLFGQSPLIYTGGPVFNKMTADASVSVLDELARRELWLAAYVQGPERFVPAAWSKRSRTWRIWQESGNKDASGRPGWRVPGIATTVDRDVLQGVASVDDWLATTVAR